MKYLLLLMGEGEMTPWSELDEAGQGAVMEAHDAFSQACKEREGVAILSGEALDGPEAATTLRTRGGAVQITDGPYAEAVECMGGFYLIEAPDLDVLLELVQHLPAYDMQIVPAIDV